MTREDVLREFSQNEWGHPDYVEMADEIVRLRAALAAAPKMTVLDQWEIHDQNGEKPLVNGVAFTRADADNFAEWHDRKFPADAPHTVRRVALLDDPTTRGEG